MKDWDDFGVGKNSLPAQAQANLKLRKLPVELNKITFTHKLKKNTQRRITKNEIIVKLMT